VSFLIWITGIAEPPHLISRSSRFFYAYTKQSKEIIKKQEEAENPEESRCEKRHAR